MNKNENSLNSDSEYQRRKSMTRDERAIDARDRVAINIYEHNRKEGRDIPFDRCLEKATDIANKQHRRDQNK